MNSDTKVYETVGRIDQDLAKIKPGLTAVVEIQIETARNVLCIPPTSIVQRGKGAWCYVIREGGIERSNLELGRTNDRWVEVCDGLEPGDRVVLHAQRLLKQDEPQRREIGPGKDVGTPL